MSEPVVASMAALRFAEHKAFLRLVHAAPGGGDELYLGRALPGAIERYLEFWLPLVAREGGGEGGERLIPPVDVAWVWHLHRLAPRRYAAYCTERFGRVLDPTTAAFQAQSEAAEADAASAEGETRRLWQHHFGDVAFFQPRGEADGRPAEWGPRDPLSHQTTVAPEVREACARVRSAHGWDYEVETCSARQRTFLWQVSRPGCADAAAMSTRYLRFLGLMRAHGYSEHFFVPSYDIDFAWHTHMLTSTSDYLRETELLANAPGGVDHDDSVNQRHEDSKLHRGWADTKAMWALDHSGASDPIDKAGVTYRGEPPDWWFQTDGAEVFRVRDGFLSASEVASALERLRNEANIRGRAHSGLDMVCQVSGDVMRRLQEQLDAEEHSPAGHELADPKAEPPARAAAVEPAVDLDDEEAAAEHELVEVPARVCPASKSVPVHKDKPDGRGASLDSWISVVYLTRQPASTLVLVDDLTGNEYKVAIEPGRLCCWPNARFSHRVDVDPAAIATAMTDPVAVAQAANLASYRCMLGPMAFRQPAGADSGGEELIYTEGGCGGGCGGGGACGGGATGGGGPPSEAAIACFRMMFGESAVAAAAGTTSRTVRRYYIDYSDYIENSETVKVIGHSVLEQAVLDKPKGTADPNTMNDTLLLKPYQPEYRSFFSGGLQEGLDQMALWQQIQTQIGLLESYLAQIANLSPDYSWELVCEGCCCCPEKGLQFTREAVIELIDAARDAEMASINVQLEALGFRFREPSLSSTHRVCLQFGGATYYLTLVERCWAGNTAAKALAEAQAAETAAQAALAPYAAVPAKPAAAMPAAPGGQVQVAMEVPPGVTAGQTVQIEVAGVGGGRTYYIENSETVKIIGHSVLERAVLDKPKGTADPNTMNDTLLLKPYQPEYRSFFSGGLQEGLDQMALWQQIQTQIGLLESYLAQIANLSPDYSWELVCEGLWCCPEKGLQFTRDAVIELIDAARDAEMASINVQLQAFVPLSSTHRVCLQFGGANNAYYLALVERSAGNMAAQALAAAQAAETAAQAALAPYAAVPAKPAAAMPAAPGGQVKVAVAPGGQVMVAVEVSPGVTAGQPVQIEVAGVGSAVQVPPGLTQGQGFLAQVPLAARAAQPVPAVPPVAMQIQNR